MMIAPCFFVFVISLIREVILARGCPSDELYRFINSIGFGCPSSVTDMAVVSLEGIFTCSYAVVFSIALLM